MASARSDGSIAIFGLAGLAVIAALAQALAQQPPAAPPPQTKAAREQAYLDKLGQLIETKFKDRSVGYAVVVMLPSGASVAKAGGSARRAPDPSPRPMSADDKITVASVSKTMTAAAIMQLLARNKLSVDAPVWPYLPSTWKFGDGVKDITFGGLLSHRAGIRCATNVDYVSLKNCFATALVEADKGQPKYNNSNYGVMRIILPRLDGMAVATIQDLEDRDRRGDPAPIATVLAAQYVSYLNAHVFKPAGLPAMYCKYTDAAPAMSYKSANTADVHDFSKLGPGDNWGDMTLRCGSQGWFFSARQLAIFMHALTHTSKILPPETVAQMKAQQIGLFGGNHGSGLRSYSHGGFHPAEMNKGEIHTLIADFNNGLTIGLVINSKFKGDSYFTELVRAIRDAGTVPTE